MDLDDMVREAQEAEARKPPESVELRDLFPRRLTPKAKKPNKLHLWLVTIIVGSLSVGVLAALSNHAPNKTQPSSTSQSELSLRRLIVDGAGDDFLALSDRDRMRLCLMIEEAVGKHSGWQYQAFLMTFYGNARRDDRADLMGWRIKEVAAAAASMEMRD
ncbi:hypothetical protein Pla175_45430 [Pirellulimonas nuda]|uniref:Uncharacterized protein n=1 Tax=Pirellulimonas nuda TaxID=2528009 RepID=A0A518DI34_9BACT|nr:hypothetical protein [Pirellulimonas nuda]QDU91124.1 hypothetical protein Pla175_45430 [Pirellulimonas nuda]